MVTDIHCPDSGKLADYARNGTAPEDAAALDEHLAACRACLNRYLKM